MANNNEENQTVSDSGVQGNKENAKNNAPLKILSSGRIVGNVGAQWKEVGDKRVQGKGKQVEEVTKTGQEIVPGEKQNIGVPRQVQTNNKFDVLEIDNSEDNTNNQLALVEEQTDQTNMPKPKDHGKLNLAAANFISKYPGTDKGGKEGKKKLHVTPAASSTPGVTNKQRNREDTGMQEVPTQDTRVDANLANNVDNDNIVDTEFEIFQSNEKVKWTRGRLWEDQTEEDEEEGEIPDGIQSEEEIGGDSVEDEDQTVNGKAKGTGTSVDQSLNNKEIHANDQQNSNRNQNNKEGHKSEACLKEQENIKGNQHRHKDISAESVEVQEGNTDNIDPGGTVQTAGVSNVNANTKEAEIANDKKKRKLQESNGITVLLNSAQLQTSNMQSDQDVLPISQANIVVPQRTMEVEEQLGHAKKTGRDMDEESSIQNILNVAKQGDLSPRHIEQVKSAAKGRRKQTKETSNATVGGVQTRRTLSKNQNH
ncbi:PREDICTED: uncharacterized protein DDB_G0290685-like [Nicotiana attenuata]|uniref:uncharacterized protein DDB_G0290685-like n=1 Tax=Nicotiana attenuata TaxID=49451 RepID=UPI000904BCF4|nr:PREDICTED: uncharacterized protein DDB_G0290685-like [Nicotiana attenuata]